MHRTTGTNGSAEDDAILLQRVRRGDENAMAALYDRYGKIVYSVALRVLRDVAAAEDVLQEIFMQVWRNPGSFLETKGSLGGWLAVVARNRTMDALRRRKPTDQVEEVALAAPRKDLASRSRMPPVPLYLPSPSLWRALSEPAPHGKMTP